MKYIIVLIILTLGSILCSSCFSSSTAADDFRTGFRQGWNSTAPAEYRY